MEKTIKLENMKEPLIYSKLLDSLDVTEDDIVYLGGSLIEALVNKYGRRVGNKLSDLDIFVLKKNVDYINVNATYSTEICKTDFMECQGINCDIEYYDISIINEIFKGINSIHFDESERILNSINMPKGFTFDKVNEFMTRFIYSIPIFNIEKFEVLKESVDTDLFFKIKEYYCIQGIDNIKTDIFGNIEKGEYTTAFLLCREAAFKLIEYIFSREKIYNDRKKWAWIKIENLASEKSEYEDVFTFLKNVILGDSTKIHKDKVLNHVLYLENKIEEYNVEVDF